MELGEWAKRKLVEELQWTREASTVGRRAFHEGVAAVMAFEAGDTKRATNIVTTVVADYTGVRRSQALEGMRVGTAMIRGVASYLEAAGEANVDAWAGGPVSGAMEASADA